MNPEQIFMPIAAYLPFIFYFLYNTVDVFVRNPKKTEHRLVSLISLSYALTFLEEFVRALLPISYSPTLNVDWFMTVGTVLPSLLLHFILRITGTDRFWRIRLYPAVLYVPALLAPIYVIFEPTIAEAAVYRQSGPWKWPIYGTVDYAGIAVGVLVVSVYVVMLWRGRSRALSPERKAIFNLLILGASLVVVWNLAFGFVNLGDPFPPYPYIYAGVLWSAFLRRAMIRHDFMDFTNMRYEKLFNMTPDAILLVARNGRIKEANPAARRLFNQIPLSRVGLAGAAGDELVGRIDARLSLEPFETTLRNGTETIYALVNGDYVTIDEELFAYLIMRDITKEKADAERYRYQAEHDSLTGLPNRPALERRLAAMLASAREENRRFAVVYLKLSGLSKAYARGGLAAGDRLRVRAAGIVEEALAAGDFAGQFGSEDFCVLLWQKEEHDARELLESIGRRLARLQPDGGTEEGRGTLGLACGIAIYPSHGQDAEALLSLAIGRAGL
ncbi:GGDEF domain-containing protein [Cohnella fermenti]|uniref:Diguanylate cyclase n=1 Tax=Cohnella fermenti TaxID=2565925 RepID=A0A4S4BKK6_9BACL|nr:diguanylate cyclase [Cohnella fermenti]THF75259.1 diguanylate cyclase [Cohnella fermenti]